VEEKREKREKRKRKRFWKIIIWLTRSRLQGTPESLEQREFSRWKKRRQRSWHWSWLHSWWSERRGSEKLIFLTKNENFLLHLIKTGITDISSRSSSTSNFSEIVLFLFVLVLRHWSKRSSTQDSALLFAKYYNNKTRLVKREKRKEKREKRKKKKGKRKEKKKINSSQLRIWNIYKVKAEGLDDCGKFDLITSENSPLFPANSKRPRKVCKKWKKRKNLLHQ